MTESEKEKARTLFERGDFAAAEEIYRRIVDASPDDAAAYYNLGVILSKLERFEEAMGCYRKTIELNPSFAQAYTNFGFCLNAFNLIAQAREAFSLARKLATDNPIPVVNEGIAALALGDYKNGWKDFAARWQLPAYAKFKRDFPKPVWNGENLSGKSLFLYAEQGFGDTIQMARYVPVLAARGAKIILEVQPSLKTLMSTLQGSPIVVAKGDSLPDFDCYCAMMDVPASIGTMLDTIPSVTPYLFADAVRMQPYQFVPPGKKARRIGLSWAGRSSHENDGNRSLAFTELAPLWACADVEWISLQRLIPPRDLAAATASRIADWGQGFADFAATAAAIMTLDLVITVDTSVAHLAGALGKPVWILLPFYADWRWLTERKDSPWYPTARLFRQKRPGDWEGQLSDIRHRLSEEIPF